MFTDRDFYKSLVAGALESFGTETLAAILNVPAAELGRWAQGRSRPPVPLLLQLIDLMWPGNAGASRRPHAGPPRVLMAVPPSARDAMAPALADYPVDFACSLAEGDVALRRTTYSHVIVGYLFADSHMFEFAQRAREAQASARILCVKGGGRSLGDEVRGGLDAAARELGCEGFFDLTAGELPESFNRVFDQIVRHFVSPGGAGFEARAIEPAVSRLRERVKDLRFAG